MSQDSEQLIIGGLLFVLIPIVAGVFTEALVVFALVGGFFLFGYFTLMGVGLLVALFSKSNRAAAQRFIDRLIYGRLARVRRQ